MAIGSKFTDSLKRGLQRTAGFTQAAETVFDHTAHLINLYGMFQTLAFNGNIFRGKEFAKSAKTIYQKAFLKKDPEALKFFAKAKEKGVVDSSVNAEIVRRNIDVFDIKSDVVKTLVELGIEEKNLFVNDNTKHSYHPGRSGSVTLKSEKGPHLAYFGEIHPAIIKNLDCKDKNIFGFEIFLKNIPEPNKKLRQTKKSFKASDYQKSERDFAFVIDKIFKIGLLEKVIKEIDNSLIQEVKTFDVYEGENIPKDKKSVAINVTLQAIDKTLSENDLDEISKRIIDTVSKKTGATIRS